MQIREFMKQAPQIRAEWARNSAHWKISRSIPPQMKNDAAMRVEKLFADLKLDKEQAVKDKLGDYTKSQLESTDVLLAVPPKELVDFFSRKHSEIMAYRKQLIDGPVPQWAQDITQGPISSYLPNLLMHIQTQKFFTAGALIELKGGRPDEANDFLEAAWKANQGMKLRPELMCQLIYIASMRYQIGIVRRMSEVPAVWEARSRDMDDRDSLHRSMAMEVYSHSVLQTKIGLGEMKIPVTKRVGIRPHRRVKKNT
jgi:hypothetical protein